ncbi:MAG: hypothetical protein N2606_04940, partial [Candidatus Omnitrophica bacterium]|nr:hypothetical protein [Candidatus Omnitrophota bacterium]
MFRRIIAVSLVFCFLIQQAGFTQLNNSFAIPDYLAGLLLPERFRPLNLQLLTFDKITNEVTAGFDLGDLIGKDSKEIESQIEQVKDYFMTALVLPNSTFWVNLRPDSPYQIMDEDMAKTQLGKVLVEADLQLKKDLAQLTSPQHSLGRRFWSEIYGKINTLFNPEEDIEIPTMTRPWIVPGEIILGQSDNRVYIYKATLKVCLEEDWLEWSNKHKQVPISDTTILLDKNDNRIKELNRYASELVHQLILPQLTRQVNQSRKYASLRQVYHCLILANWVKEYVKANNLSKKSKIFSKIDSRDLTSFTLPKQWSLETYFNEYRKSFFQGEYNLQEEVEGKFGIELRQYISGGFDARDGGLSQATTSFFTRIGDFVIRLGNLVIKKLTEASFDIEEKKDMEYYLKLIEELKDETIFSKHPEPLLLAMLVFDHDGEIDKVKCFSGSTTEGKLRRGEFGVTADGKLVLVKEGWDISNLPSDEIRERQLPDVVLLEEGKDYVLVKKTFPEGEIWLFLNKKRLKGELFSSKYDGGQLAQIEKLYLWYQRNNLQRPTEEQNKINQLFASALAYLDQKTSLPALTRTDNPFFVLKQSLEVLVENKERYKQLFNEKEVNIEELLIYETIDTLAQSIFNQVVFRIKETDNTFSEEQVDSLKEIVKKLNNLDPLLAEKILQITEDLKS